MYLCKCDCGNETDISGSSLRKGIAKSCRCLISSRGKDALNWKGYGDISGRVWGTIKAGAKNRGLSISITIKDIWNVYQKQNGTCSLSGLPISFFNTDARKNGTASLDRVDSSLGYTIENIQWVHRDINKIKSNYKQQQFIELCHLVAKNNPL